MGKGVPIGCFECSPDRQWGGAAEASSFVVLAAGGVGVDSAAAGAAVGVSELEVGGAAVDVVLAKGRRPAGRVVRVPRVRLLAGFSRQTLLREALVFAHVGVPSVLTPPRQRQTILQRRKAEPCRWLASWLALVELTCAIFGGRVRPLCASKVRDAVK